MLAQDTPRFTHMDDELILHVYASKTITVESVQGAHEAGVLELNLTQICTALKLLEDASTPNSTHPGNADLLFLLRATLFEALLPRKPLALYRDRKSRLTHGHTLRLLLRFGLLVWIRCWKSCSSTTRFSPSSVVRGCFWRWGEDCLRVVQRARRRSWPSSWHSGNTQHAEQSIQRPE